MRAVDVLTQSGVEGGNVPAYHWHTPRPASGSLWNYDDETFVEVLKANPLTDWTVFCRL